MAYNPPADVPAAYANWGQRVGAAIIDALPAVGLWLVTTILSVIIHNLAVGLVLTLIYWAGSLGWWVYNRVITMGNTGQSLGKRMLGIKLVSESTGAPIGAGMALVRDIAHIIDAAICLVGYLFPLWDAKAQTLADKIMSTVVLPA